VLAGIVEAAGGEPLGEEPWSRWRRHRFDLSADRLRELLEPAGAYVDTIEVAARWSALPAIYEEIKAHLAAATGLALCHFSHALAQGCCAYFTFAGTAEDEAGALAVHAAGWRGAMEIALRRGATITHHHGVGRARAPWIRAELGEWWEVWDRVRAALDPGARLNPNAVGGRHPG
jgi:alkyldihydroxyacetonephosphate synthase